MQLINLECFDIFVWEVQSFAGGKYGATLGGFGGACVFGIGKGRKNTLLTELETRKWLYLLYLLVFCFYTSGIFGSMWDCLIQGISQPFDSVVS